MLNKAFEEKRRLILWLTLLLTVGFAATSLVSYFVSKNSIRHEIVSNELPLTTDNVYSEIQKDLIRTVFVSSMMARDTFLRDWILDGERDTVKITRYLKEVQQKYDTITSFFISEKSRIYYNENGILKNVTERNPLDKWYFRIRQQSEPYELNLDASEAHAQALTIFVNYRVTDYQGNLIGITGVGLMVDSLRKLIDQYQDRYRRNVYLIDKQGKIVLHGSQFHPGAENIREMPGLGTQAAHLLDSKEGQYEYRREGGVYQLNARFIPELGWYLLVEKDEGEALTDVRNTLFLNLGICAAITFLVALLTGLSINRHQARLKRAIDNHTAELNAALGEASKMNQAKNQMLAYIGHDLRTPLANIVHYTHLLGTASGGDTRQYLSAIERSSHHQLELIDELMEYSRGELDQLKLFPAPTYLYAFLQDIAGQGELLAAHQNNRFVMALADNMPPVVVIDEKRLRQVLFNLLSNAAKFTSGGDIRLRVEIAQGKPDSARRLCFAIEDTGEGILEADQRRIFQPYERSKSDRPGTGLGLAIAGQIVSKMGCELKMESALGIGSRFWFEMPLETAQEDDVLQSVQAFAMPEPFGTGKRILIVESNRATRDYLNEILSLADFDVSQADDMDGAIQQLSGASCDAILITGMAQKQSAWEFLLKLHESHPENTPPVILFSAAPPQRPADFPAHLGFRVSKLKPVEPEKLLEVMRELFSSRPAIDLSVIHNS
ncbi:MAG TPA: ATP-binding protein [Gallionella sp.]|nr:ATP-binding protein [Gallionella sp.]